jgi:predicted DNA-binding transcriptional regulator AlpA
MTDSEELLIPSRVAKLLRTTERSLGQMRYQRKGPKYVKVGERVLYRRSDIRDYLDSRTVQTA